MQLFVEILQKRVIDIPLKGDPLGIFEDILWDRDIEEETWRYTYKRVAILDLSRCTYQNKVWWNFYVIVEKLFQQTSDKAYERIDA